MQSPEDQALERAALWGTTFHLFFGGRRGRDELPTAVRPMSAGQTARVLQELAKQPDRRHAVCHCLSQMLVSGHIPDRHNIGEFRDLVHAAVPKKPPDEAIVELREKGLREYPFPDAGPGLAPLVPDKRRREPVPGPTKITYDSGNILTATKEVLVPESFARVRPLAEPRNWPQFGPFWESRNGKPPIEEKWVVADPRRRYRKGEVIEHFVINWNRVRVARYDVHLRATQEWDADMIRTDYSLIYEESRELLVDEGYGEVRRSTDHPGWSVYTGVKRIKFASDLLNLFAPGVLAMFLDSIGPAFQKIFQPKPRRRTRRR
jgi:hypothetical protein